MKKMMSVRLFILLALGISALTATAQDSAIAGDAAVKTVKAGIINGKAISLPKPEYSAETKAAGLEGTVFVDVLIDETGKVISAVADAEPRKVPRSNTDPELSEIPVADPILREAAEKAALEARFSPTLLSGVPVRVSGSIVYNFVLRTATPSQINGGVLNGKATSLPRPQYPDAARAVRAAGAVSVQVTIDEGGNVISATAVAGHPLLRAAAVEAARSATFSPTTLSGQPVKVTGIITYNFVAPTDSN